MEKMNGCQRVFGVLKAQLVDHLALMPVTMQLAADRIGRKYYDYATDFRVLVEGQLKIAEEFDFDHVGCISDPAREAADCGASIVYAEDSPPAIAMTISNRGRCTVLRSLWRISAGISRRREFPRWQWWRMPAGRRWRPECLQHAPSSLPC